MKKAITIKKTITMKKTITFVLVALGLQLFLNSCSKEDSPAPDVPAITIEGKWTFSKEGKTINGQEVLSDYIHTMGCAKDYMEIKSDGTGSYYFYSSSVTPCQLSTDNFTWTKEGSTSITFTQTYEGGQKDVYTAQIISLTANQLKLKYSSGDIDIFVK